VAAAAVAATAVAEAPPAAAAAAAPAGSRRPVSRGGDGWWGLEPAGDRDTCVAVALHKVHALCTSGNVRGDCCVWTLSLLKGGWSSSMPLCSIAWGCMCLLALGCYEEASQCVTAPFKMLAILADKPLTESCAVMCCDAMCCAVLCCAALCSGRLLRP
jgi:hypothetical protein